MINSNKHKKGLPAEAEAKAGYKKTKLGWIPKNWKVERIGKLTKTTTGGTPKTSIEEYWNGNIKWMSSGELNLKKIYDVKGRITEEGLNNSSTKIIPSKCILIGLAGQGKTRGTIAMNMVELCTNQSVAAIMPSKTFITEYIYYNLDFRYSEIRQLSTGDGGRGGLNLNIINSIILPLPPLPEQKAIVSLLNTWDEAITKTKALIAQKELRKKWLMQNLLTGKKRFPEYINNDKNIKTKVGKLPKDWEIIHISDLLIRVKNHLIPELNKLYQEIGIRSHTKGIFYKKSRTGKSLGNKSVFWIQPDCFIVNIVFAWEHAVAKTTDKEVGMIASHRFPMYKPKQDILDLDYLLNFFKSKRGKHLLGLASPGGAGRNKTLGQTEFMKLQIPVPDIKEQRKIATVLQTADKEIETLKAKLEKLKEQKKGLMQQLLTGKKCLNCDL